MKINNSCLKGSSLHLQQLFSPVILSGIWVMALDSSLLNKSSTVIILTLTLLLIKMAQCDRIKMFQHATINKGRLCSAWFISWYFPWSVSATLTVSIHCRIISSLCDSLTEQQSSWWHMLQIHKGSRLKVCIMSCFLFHINTGVKPVRFKWHKGQH